MNFVASMTHRPPELRQIWQYWQQHGDIRNPFQSTIFTPLFAQSGVLDFVRQNFEADGGVMFDSGGYFVQQGAATYESLYQRLLAFYRANGWAKWYVLPDYVPTTGLSPSEVEARVEATITVARLFVAEMPPSLRDRALPVVQGYTREQIHRCVVSYAELGVKCIGFGSFGTSGENNSINTVSRQSLELIEYLKKLADRYQLSIHLFGVGTPEVLADFYDIGVDSFDSSCWSRTAGYGNVYLPFVGRRNLSQRMAREIGGPAYEFAEFANLRQATGHRCPFCEDIGQLQHNRMYQMLHNLYVMMDTVEALNQGKPIVARLVGVRQSRYERLRKPRLSPL